jgi:hypothetical protein
MQATLQAILLWYNTALSRPNTAQTEKQELLKLEQELAGILAQMEVILNQDRQETVANKTRIMREAENLVTSFFTLYQTWERKSPEQKTDAQALGGWQKQLQSCEQKIYASSENPAMQRYCPQVYEYLRLAVAELKSLHFGYRQWWAGDQSPERGVYLRNYQRKIEQYIQSLQEEVQRLKSKSR